MGINPNEDLYTGADNAGYCEIDLFDGRTPKFIELHVSGVILCPVATTPSPNGTYVLTQTSLVRWNYEDDDRFIQIELQNTKTVLGILGKPGLQNVFIGEEARCVDEIANDQVDCSGGNYGHSGNAVFYWGPGISP